jgi:hypothetical protein
MTMTTDVMSIRSFDGNLELALCPSSVELRLSPKAAAEFDRACEAQKSAAWLPIWRQIKGGLVSAAQFMAHKVADKLRSIPLDAVTDVSYSDGRLQVRTAEGNQIKGQVKIGIGSYSLEYHLDGPGIFAEADAAAFVKRVSEVKPMYEEYLGKLRRSAK